MVDHVSSILHHVHWCNSTYANGTWKVPVQGRSTTLTCRCMDGWGNWNERATWWMFGSLVRLIAMDLFLCSTRSHFSSSNMSRVMGRDRTGRLPKSQCPSQILCTGYDNIRQKKKPCEVPGKHFSTSRSDQHMFLKCIGSLPLGAASLISYVPFWMETTLPDLISVLCAINCSESERPRSKVKQSQFLLLFPALPYVSHVL